MKKIISVFMLLLFPALNVCGQQVSSDMRTLLSSEGKVLYGDEPNSIVVKDYPDNLDQVGQYLEMLDVSPKQVLVEARVVEVVLKNEHSLGVNWSLLASQGGLKIGGYKVTSEGKNYIEQKIPFIDVRKKPADIITSIVDPFTLAVSNSNIDAVLKAMSTSLDTDVLSAPRVATVNNRPADISIIQRYPWAEPELTTSDSGSTTVTWKINWEDIGIILHVTPVINADGDISLTLHPDISELVDQKLLTVTSGSASLDYQIPVIDKRTATTKVIVGNGQTLIFGGLIKDRVKKNYYKVPLVGDLPLVGQLFKSSNTFKEKTELLILVSPTIINSDEMTHMAKQLRYGVGGKYVLDKERQEKMLLTMENREIQRKIDLNSKWDALTKKQQELVQQTKELEKTVLSEENSLKKLEETKEAVIAKKKSLSVK
jgi:type II secretory pathway component GspD/PulD (secretin)